MTTAIDGGRDYTRVGFKNMPPHNLRIDLVGGLTAHLLGVEENKHLGLLKTKNVVYDTLYRYTLNERGDFRRYAKK